MSASLLLSGCIVQSLNPFYTKEALTELPRLDGEWVLTIKAGDDVTGNNIKPWRFKGDEIQTFDKNGVGSFLKVSYFRVGEQLFADFFPGDPDDRKVNGWWAIHVAPVHTVSKVSIDGKNLTFTPLNYEWLKKALKTNKITLSHIKIEDEDHLIFTAGSKAWMDFLKRHKNNKGAFDYELRHLFIRKG